MRYVTRGREFESRPEQGKTVFKIQEEYIFWNISISQQKQVAIGWTLEIDKIPSKIGTIEKQINKISWSRQKTNEIFIDLGFILKHSKIPLKTEK